MNCISCGAIVPDGATSCPGCGQPIPVQAAPQQPMYQQAPQQPMYQQAPQQQMYQQAPQQPMYQQAPQQQMYQQAPQQQMYQQPQQPMYQQAPQQPMYQQPMGGYAAGPAFNSGKFVNDLKTNYLKLISMIGAILITIAPFFHWFSLKVRDGGKTAKEGFNMFSLGNEMDNGAFTFFAIMMLVLGLVLICLELADYMPALANIKAKIPSVEIVEVAIVAAVLVFWLLAFFNGDLMDGIKYSKDRIKDYYTKGHCNHGIGPIVALIGIAGAAFRRVTKLISGKQ